MPGLLDAMRYPSSRTKDAQDIDFNLFFNHANQASVVAISITSWSSSVSFSLRSLARVNLEMF